MKAYCPSHITCFFSPVDSQDVLHKGSLGAGIRLDSGTVVTMEDSERGRRFFINGERSEAHISENVLDRLMPNVDVDIYIESELPFGQGFGMSASGAIAIALCATSLMGGTNEDAFICAHFADVEGKGGLGDVAALTSRSHQPVRVRSGIPPNGDIIDPGISFEGLTLAILGPKLSTSFVLEDKGMYDSIISVGKHSVEDYLDCMTTERLFAVSNDFSSRTGVEHKATSNAIKELKDHGIRSAMCMLGNSIFCEASESDVKDILGEITTFSTRSTDAPPRIIRKG